MKIVVITDMWFPAVGGGQINAWEISKRLAKKGVNIDIVTRNNGKDNLERIKNLNVHKLGPITAPDNTTSKLAFLLRAFLFVVKKDYDVIHAHPFLPALPAKLVAIIKHKPIVLTVHGTRLFESRKTNTPSRILEKFILTSIKYDLQISVTKAFTRLKNRNTKIVIIPNAVNVKEFEKVKTKKSAFLKILWVGRFDPVKRVEDLIYATKLISKKTDNVKLVLIGYGYEEERLKRLVKKLRLKNIIFIHTNSKTELIKQYKSSHVFVLSSESEGQPITLLEAQASKLPIVATKVGGIPEIVNNKSGLLVPPKSPQILAKAIIQVLSKKDQFAESGFEAVQKNHNWDKISKMTFDVYKKALNGKNNHNI